MALEDVNARSDLLSEYRLDMIWRDSKCDPGLGVTQLYDLLYEEPTKVMILSGCSDVTTVVAEAVPMWNLVVVSYGSSSPALSDRGRFRTFFRTHPSAVLQNPARLKLFEFEKWKKIAILLEASELFISTAEDLEAQCKKAGVEITHRQILQTGAVSEAVRTLKQIDARIIVGLFYEQTAIDVFCAVSCMPPYCFFTPRWVVHTIASCRCEKEEVRNHACQEDSMVDGQCNIVNVLQFIMQTHHLISPIGISCSV